MSRSPLCYDYKPYEVCSNERAGIVADDHFNVKNASSHCDEPVAKLLSDEGKRKRLKIQRRSQIGVFCSRRALHPT